MAVKTHVTKIEAAQEGGVLASIAIESDLGLIELEVHGDVFAGVRSERRRKRWRTMKRLAQPALAMCSQRASATYRRTCGPSYEKWGAVRDCRHLGELERVGDRLVGQNLRRHHNRC
jgi:hypothetical protein